MKLDRSVCVMTAAWLALTFGAACAWSKPCRLTPMQVSGQTAQSSGVSIDLGEASPPDPSAPPAYQGPVRIRVGNGPTCTASQDVSIVAGQPWLGGGKVYLSTYSGSENRLFALDTRNCRIVWKSALFEGPPATYQHGAFTMGSHRARLTRSCMPAH